MNGANANGVKRLRNIWLVISGALGALAVVIGAFGAHGLKERLAPDLLAIWETGARYHMYHAIAMLAVSLLVTAQGGNKWLRSACVAWLIGIVVFSGSLYALSLTGIRGLGAITPFGGVALIIGWCFVIVAGLRTNRRDSQ